MTSTAPETAEAPEGAGTVDLLDATGEKVGTVELPADVFDVQVNIPLIHQVVVAQLAAAYRAKGEYAEIADGTKFRSAE